MKCVLSWRESMILMRVLHARRASVVVRSAEKGAAANGNQPVFVCDLPQQLRVSHSDATLATGITKIWEFLEFLFNTCIL